MSQNDIMKHSSLDFSTEIIWVFPILSTDKPVLFVLFCVLSTFLSIFNMLCRFAIKRVMEQKKRIGKLRSLMLITMKFSILIQKVFLLFLISSFNFWIILSILVGQVIGYSWFFVEEEMLLPTHTKME